MIEFFQVYVEFWDEWWPQLAVATLYTIGLTVIAFTIGIVLGLALALGKLSHITFVRRISIAYIEFTRGIPTLALLFLLYFGLPPLGILLDEFVAGFIGLGMIAAGYLAEIFRGGIEAVHKGQREAALAIGMTPFTAFRYIVFPQAIRVVLPPLLNTLIIVLKDSSVCSIITTPELMLRAKDIATMDFVPMHLYLLAGLIYFGMAWPLSLLTRRLEIRMRRGLHG